jgi:hypothetical protein
VEFRGQNKGEKEGKSESKNKPKNYNILPKDHSKVDLQISWRIAVA